ncbi:hypothetical protein JW872_03995 [Candidatus Babeliales bacterium]|nr:hypothetical protein [Candidatus Babeliales bacterium]
MSSLSKLFCAIGLVLSLTVLAVKGAVTMNDTMVILEIPEALYNGLEGAELKDGDEVLNHLMTKAPRYKNQLERVAELNKTNGGLIVEVYQCMRDCNAFYMRIRFSRPIGVSVLEQYGKVFGLDYHFPYHYGWRLNQGRGQGYGLGDGRGRGQGRNRR